MIVDGLIKAAHFFPMKVNFSMDRLASFYVKEIVRMHGVPVSISDHILTFSHLVRQFITLTFNSD